MVVHVRQVNGPKVNDDRDIPTPEGMTAAEYLEAKYASHAAHGWAVERKGSGFVARKNRWGGRPCVRTFTVI